MKIIFPNSITHHSISLLNEHIFAHQDITRETKMRVDSFVSKKVIIKNP